EAVQVMPLDDGARDYYIVSLIVTVQRFRVGPEFETAEDAEWYAGQLRHALSFLTRALTRPAPSDEEAWRDIAFANAAIVDEIREIVGLKGKPGDVVEEVRKLVALRDGEAKRPAAVVDEAAVRRVIAELRAYNPAADEYKGAHIHKVWARELAAALATH